MRWGILSTGAIARTFAKHLGQSRTGKLVAVASRTLEAAEKFDAGDATPRRYGSYAELLADSEVEAVYIATPHPRHACWTIAAAAAGKHILCEKPLTINHPEAMAVVDAAHRHGVILMEAFMYRCHPQTAKLVEILRSGMIGDVRLIQASFAFRTPDNNLSARTLNHALAGGGILDVGCYCVSMARLIAGVATGRAFAEPDELRGLGHIGMETRVDEYAIAALKFSGEILAELSVGVRLSTETGLRVYGTNGHLVVRSPWVCTVEAGVSVIEVFPSGAKEPRRIEIQADRGLFAFEADAFAALVWGRPVEEPVMSPADSLGNMQTLDRWRAAVGMHYDMEKPISRVVMGTVLDSAVLPAPHAHALWDDFVERGGNGFDTAHSYGNGASEKIFGQWLRNRGGDALRKRFVVIGKGAHTPDCFPAALTAQLNESLGRMGLEYVDIYLMHRDNPGVPVGEFVDVLNEHLNAGRIRAFGGSNWTRERVDAANRYARENGLRGFTAISTNFSLARVVNPPWAGFLSNSDAASREWLERTQLSEFAWSSQARGFFERGDVKDRSDRELADCWYCDDNFQRFERVRELAGKLGVRPANIATAYLLNQPFPTFALVGPRSLARTDSVCSALELALTPEQLRWLNLEE